MQIATVCADQPWICTVYFVHDDDRNLYWVSLPERRHSREIAKNSSVAIAIAVKHDQPVVGIQAEGSAQEISDLDTIKSVMRAYVDKYNTGEKFYDNFVSGKNQHHMYKFTPVCMVLFDEVNHPGSPTIAQEVLYSDSVG